MARAKKTAVVVSGGFDPLHSGHLNLLREAKLLGEKEVIVALRALVLSQTVGRLIDSHHPAVRVAVRKQGGTHPRATKRIKYQWAGLIFERLLEYAERVTGMFRARFAPEMLTVTLYHRQ